MALERVVISLDVMLLGNNHVGKTEWLNWVRGKDEQPSRRTRLNLYAVDNAVMELFFRHATYQLNFSNVNGQEKFQRNVNDKISKYSIDVFIVFYDVNNRASFDDVDKYVSRFRELNKNRRAIGILIGMRHSNQVCVSESEAEAKAASLALHSYYAVNLITATDLEIMQPLYYIVKHAQPRRVCVPKLDLNYFKEALAYCSEYTKDPERKKLLKDVEDTAAEFEQLQQSFTVDEYEALQAKAGQLHDKAQEIYKGAYSERIKMIVFGIAAAALLVASFATAIILLLPIALSAAVSALLLAGCIAMAGTGIVSAGFSIFKSLEYSQYKDLCIGSIKLGEALPALSYNGGFF